MGLITVEEFKKNVKAGKYSNRSAACKAVGKCKSWGDLEKHQVKNWLAKVLPDVSTPTPPKKEEKVATTAAPTPPNGQKKRGRPRKNPEQLASASKPAKVEKKTAKNDKSSNGGFQKPEQYLSIVERVSGLAPHNKEVTQLIISGLTQVMGQVNQAMGFAGVAVVPPPEPRKRNVKVPKVETAPASVETIVLDEEESDDLDEDDSPPEIPGD